MSEVKVLTSDTYGAETGSGAVVVDFYADWCGPCKMMAPTFHAAAEEFDGKIKFCKINIDENREAAIANSVASIPTLIFYKDGKVADRVSGVMDGATLAAKLNAIL